MFPHFIMVVTPGEVFFGAILMGLFLLAVLVVSIEAFNAAKRWLRRKLGG